jgi:hypothetical protein
MHPALQSAQMSVVKILWAWLSCLLAFKAKVHLPVIYAFSVFFVRKQVKTINTELGLFILTCWCWKHVLFFVVVLIMMYCQADDISQFQLLETVIKNCGDILHMHVAERDVLHEMVKIVKKKV